MTVGLGNSSTLLPQLASWKYPAMDFDHHVIPPFSTTMLQRLVQPMIRTPHLETFLAKLMAANNGTQFSISVVGGSMTAGEGCVSRWTEPKGRRLASAKFHSWNKCAWSARLVNWLHHAFPDCVFWLTNHAKRAWGTQVWALEGIEANPIFREADLVLTDLAINAGVDGIPTKMEKEATAAVWAAALSLPKRPAVLAVEVVEGIFTRNFYDMDVKFLQKICPETADQVAFAGRRVREFDHLHATNRSEFRVCRSEFWPAVWHQQVATTMGIPVVSYHDALWPALDEPDPDFPLFWNGQTHPSNGTHQRIADAVAFGISWAARRLRAMGGSPIGMDDWERAASRHDNHSRTALQQCTPAATRLHPPQDDFQPASPPVGWEFGEDVVGNSKPGWLARASFATLRKNISWIEFDAVIGEQRLVLVGHLGSTMFVTEYIAHQTK